MGFVTIAYLVWLLVINIVTLAAFARDKAASRAGRRRTPERTLQGMMLAGGVVGGLIGMQRIRHKSRHLSFKVVLAVALVGHIALLLWLL